MGSHDMGRRNHVPYRQFPESIGQSRSRGDLNNFQVEDMWVHTITNFNLK